MKKILALLPLLLFAYLGFAQEKPSDANIVGDVQSEGEHLPFANVVIKGTTIGTTTDETGHYQLINLPEGKYTLVVKMVGFKPSEKDVVVKVGTTKEVKFVLEQDVLGLEEVVITADRNEKNRKDASVIVNTISPKMFETVQSIGINESLNFCSGLRTENNCSNCGFNQVRINGMEGPYSQILINSRPIFSGLAGVYGLELIPSNMVERIEVVRGGGSALYGSNAVAGTINLILKDPVRNTYQIGNTTSLTGVGVDGTGGVAVDNAVQFNASIVSADNSTGLAVYGFNRDKEAFDANNDGFSDLVELKNTTVGARTFKRFGSRSKVSFDFFNIREKRRGGDQLDKVEHEAMIAESVEHNITTGALTYEQFFREQDLWSVFASGQNIIRDSYYGAEQSLKDYGNTRDLTFTVGTQYNAKFDFSNLVMGIENRRGQLVDKKLGYLDVENAKIIGGELVIPHTENNTLSDQMSNTFGAFAQYDITWHKFNFSVGARYDNYRVGNEDDEDGMKSGNVISPRATIKYDVMPFLQTRLSYSQGYRAPQIFDEDLHIEASGSRKVLHANADNLKQETSHSYMLSVDFNKYFGSTAVGLLVEGFRTELNDAFVMDYGVPDADGTVIYTRENAEKGAVVQGINAELNFVPFTDFSLQAGFTVQSSSYGEAQEFNETKFFRTPDHYGFLALDYDFIPNLCFSASATYTGSMLVPFFGEVNELRTTEDFFDMGVKFSYDININGSKLQLATGVKNLFNAYQNDIGVGVDKDPAYIYGPGSPRLVYFGVKFGNIL